MEIPRALQDYLGSGADDAAPCILTTVDGPVRTRAGGARPVLQREDDDDGAAPADEAVNHVRRRLPRARRGVVAGRVRVSRRASPRQRGALARRLEP